nr:DUF1501 domain-containing protein [Verrucomicrobium spinosum]
MFKFSAKGSISTCDGVSRRDFLQAGALGAIGLTLPQFNALRASGVVDKKKDDRACIMIFNLGAPSQIDTWDPKPDAPREVRGPFKTIRTNCADIQLTEIFPHMAKIADKFSLVRSVYHNAAAVHDTGHQMMQTGRLFSGGINTPHVGCALEFLKGRKSELPRTSFSRSPWGQLEATCLMDRMRDSWARPTTRLS